MPRSSPLLEVPAAEGPAPLAEPPASAGDAPPPAPPSPPAPSAEARAVGPGSSVERVMAKESFAPDEPLPAFTFPVLDDAKKAELLQRVEAARGATADAPTPPPGVPSAPVEVRSETSGRRADLAGLLSDAGRIGRGASARASVLLRQWIDTACAFIDRSRARLPVRLRAPLSKVPSSAILAALVTLAFGILAGGLLLVGAGPRKQASGPVPSALTALPVPKEDPVPREIEQAKKQGHAALEKLAAQHPKDYRVWLELAASSSARGDHAAAVSAVGTALAADPGASEQALASDVLAVAIRKRATTNTAFELLQGPMASAGATVLYDLSIDPAAPPQLRGGAEQWVRSEAFKKVATPDVALAAALRYGTSCSIRHDLLPRAAEKGGRRVLDFLNIAKTPAGCGRNARKDCFPCLRKDGALKDAISAIEKRLSGK